MLREKGAAAAQEQDVVLDFEDRDQDSTDERKESHEVKVSEAAMANVSYTQDTKLMLDNQQARDRRSQDKLTTIRRKKTTRLGMA